MHRKIENEFQEFYRKTLARQRILEEASAWLLQLTATERFLHLLGRSLTLSCGATHAAVMVFDACQGFYRVMMSSGLIRIPPSLIKIDPSNPLIADFEKNKKCLNLSKESLHELRCLHAELCFPIFGSNRKQVVGLLFIGPAKSGSPYEPETISFFRTLSNDIAVEVEKEVYYNGSITDPLTGLYNRKHMDEVFQRLGGTNLKRRQIALALLDIDHFKSINDTYGHLAGDAVLKVVSDKIQHNIRKTDCCFRYGGEEFCILFQELLKRDGTSVSTTASSFFESIKEILTRVKETIDQSAVQYQDKKIHVTISVGLTFLDVTDGPFDPKSLMEKTDRLLYDAKRTGRNKIVSDGK